MEKIGIIDLGSNSVRLVLVDVYEGGYFSVFDEFSESVRLAQGMEEDGFLKPARIAQTIKTLQLMKKLCDANNVEKIYAYATSAVRNAKNQRGFLDEVFSTCGFRLHVLSEEEETQLIYQGVINSMDIPKGLIVDMGGGSTQLIYYNRRALLGSYTIPYGALTLTEAFKNKADKPEERAQLINEFFAKELSKISWLNDIDPDAKLIGVGGSFRNLGKICRTLNKYPFDVTHNYVVEKEQFKSIYKTMRVQELDSTMQIKGLNSDRADIFPSALAAIDAIVDKLDFEFLTISGCGLREGVMFHHAVPSTNDKPLTDVLGHGIYTVLKAYNENLAHAEQVYNLSAKLFKELKVLHKLPRAYVKPLRTASMLHDAGNRIKYYNHHKHSAYIILNSNIFGLTHKETIMAAFMASMHRKGDILPNEIMAYRDILTQDDFDAVKKLGVIICIAESLDRGMSGAVTDIKCDVLGDSVIMKTISEGDCSLEIKDALSAQAIFRKAYGKNLQIL